MRMNNTPSNAPHAPPPELLSDIRLLLNHARRNVAQAVNSAMVQTYWHIGRTIVEHEQSVNARAEYGKQQLAYLSANLGEAFGKGFDITNLLNMRCFYQTFPIRETVSPELSWSHYCKIIRLETPLPATGISPKRAQIESRQGGGYE